jgi:hypothetical protein
LRQSNRADSDPIPKSRFWRLRAAVSGRSGYRRIGLESRLWFAKMSSHTRRLRISNIHVDVYEREFTRNKACNIVAELGQHWTERTFSLALIGFIANRPARAVRLGFSSGSVFPKEYTDRTFFPSLITPAFIAAGRRYFYTMMDADNYSVTGSTIRSMKLLELSAPIGG